MTSFMLAFGKLRQFFVRGKAQAAASTGKADERNKPKNQHDAAWSGEDKESKELDSTMTYLHNVHLLFVDKATTPAHSDLDFLDLDTDDLNFLSKTSDWQLFQFFEGLELRNCKEPLLTDLTNLDQTFCDERSCQRDKRNHALYFAADALRGNGVYPSDDSDLYYNSALQLNND